MKKLLALLVLFSFGLAACGGDDDNGLEYPYEGDYYNATIQSSSVDGSTTKIVVQTIGYHPVNEIIVEATFVNGTLTNLEVLEEGETGAYGSALIADGAVLDALVADASNLESIDASEAYAELDATAGSTITIEALYDATLAALQHFNNYYSE